MTIDVGQCLTAAALGIFAWQARQVVGELRALRLDLTHLQRFAIKRMNYTPREE